MSWPYTCTRLCALLGLLVMVAGPSAAAAQSLETALMPGPVVRAHAKLETLCRNCHVRMDRNAQVLLSHVNDLLDVARSQVERVVQVTQ